MRKNIVTLLFVAIALVANAQINPDVKPASLEPKPFTIGEFYSFTADNGMEVFLVRKAGYPKFRLSIEFNLPAIPEETQPELRKVVNDIFEGGNESFTAKQIEDQTNFYAASLSSSGRTITLAGMKRNLDELMPMATSYLLSPSLNEKKIKASVESGIKKLESEPRNKENKKKEYLPFLVDSLSFAKSNAAAKKAATIEGYNAVTLKDARAYFRKYINPNNSSCMIIGDFTVEEARALIGKYLRKWEKGSKYVSTFENSYTTRIPKQRTIFVVDKPEAVQSRISVNWPLIDAFPYGDNEPVLMILNQIYGDGYLSYLNRNIRLDKGLSYGAKNFMNINATGGSCNSVVLVRNNQTAYALENIFYEMLRIRNQLVNQSDLEMAINGMLGDYARSVSKLNAPTIIGFGMVKSMYNLPDNYLETYPIKLAKITADDIRNAAQKYIKPYECDVVIEGKVSDLKGTLEKFGNVLYFTNDGKQIK